MATTNDNTTAAQTENTDELDAPIQARVQDGVKQAASAPFRAAAWATVKTFDMNRTAGMVLKNAIQITIWWTMAYTVQAFGDYVFRTMLGTLHDEGDTITTKRLNAEALLSYGFALVISIAVASYIETKYEQHFNKQMEEAVLTDITDKLFEGVGNDE